MKGASYLSAEGKQGRTIIARLKPGQDLLKGITNILVDKKIKAAYLPVIVGGFSDLKIISMEPASTPEGIISIEKEFKEPVEYFGMGTVAQEKGIPSIHIHLTAARSKNVAIAGHLVAGIIALVTEIVIVEIIGISMTRKKDAEVFNYPLLNFDK